MFFSNNFKSSNELTDEELNEVDEKLKTVSNSYCLAKWYQFTLNLHNGTSASCCLQPFKNLDENKIKKDAFKLYNSDEDIKERYQLLSGQKIKNCNACWKIEEKSQFSERHYKSADYWAYHNFESAKNSASEIKPTYIEVSFSNKCQLRCSYCNPNTSSAISNEVAQYGFYPDSETEMDIESRSRNNLIPLEELGKSENPFIDAFWENLPDVYSNLKVFRITGGEPFLSDDTFKFLNYVKNNPNKNMSLEFNSNLSFPDAIFDKFMTEYRSIPKSNFRSSNFYVSLDCLGERAEYIRFGMSLSKVKNNINKLLKEFENIDLTITSTISMMSAYGLKELLEYVNELKQKFGKERVKITAYPIVFPSFQSVELCNQKTREKLQDAVDYAYAQKNFSPKERLMIKAVYEKSNSSTKISLKNKLDFYSFFHEYDQRKKISFIETFPEYKDFFVECSELFFKEKEEILNNCLEQDSHISFKAMSRGYQYFYKSKEYKSVLIRRLCEIDSMSIPFIQKLGIPSECLHDLSVGVMNSRRVRDIFLLLKHNNYKYLKDILYLAAKKISRESCGIFFVWNKIALEVNVPPNYWGLIQQGLIDSFDDYYLVEALISASTHFSFHNSVTLEHDFYGPCFSEKSLPSIKDLEYILIKSDGCLKNYLSYFLVKKNNPKKVFNLIWKLALKYPDQALTVAKSISGMKIDNFKPDFDNLYVTYVFTVTLSLEHDLTKALLALPDTRESSSIFTYFSKKRIILDNELSYDFIFESYLKNKVPYRWLTPFKEMLLINSDYINDMITSNLALVDDLKGFFTFLKEFQIFTLHTKTISLILTKLNRENAYLFVNYFSNFNNRSVFLNELHDYFVSNILQEVDLVYILTMFAKKGLTFDIGKYFDLLIYYSFLTDSLYWKLFSFILKNFHDSEVLNYFVSLNKIYDQDDNVLFESYFTKYLKQSNENCPKINRPSLWYTKSLSVCRKLDFNTFWRSLLCSKNSFEFWDKRSLKYQRADKFSFYFENEYPSSESERLELVKIILKEFSITTDSTLAIRTILQGCSVDTAWTLFKESKGNQKSIIHLACSVVPSSKNIKFVESIGEEIIKFKAIDEVCIFDVNSWLSPIEGHVIAARIFNHDQVIQFLENVDDNRRFWFLKTYLNFNTEIWQFSQVKKLFDINPDLIVEFYKLCEKKYNVDFWYELAFELGVNCELSALILENSDYISLLNSSNQNDSFYSLQVRSIYNHFPWSIDDVLELESHLRIELWNLSQDYELDINWFEVIAQIPKNDQLYCMLSPIHEFILSLNDLDLSEQYKCIGYRLLGPNKNDWSVESVLKLTEKCRLELYFLSQKENIPINWNELSHRLNISDQLFCLIASNDEFFDQLLIEDITQQYVYLDYRFKGPHSGSWKKTELLLLDEDVRWFIYENDSIEERELLTALNELSINDILKARLSNFNIFIDEVNSLEEISQFEVFHKRYSYVDSSKEITNEKLFDIAHVNKNLIDFSYISLDTSIDWKSSFGKFVEIDLVGKMSLLFGHMGEHKLAEELLLFNLNHNNDKESIMSPFHEYLKSFSYFDKKTIDNIIKAVFSTKVHDVKFDLVNLVMSVEVNREHYLKRFLLYKKLLSNKELSPGPEHKLYLFLSGSINEIDDYDKLFKNDQKVH